jgi:hypothetical protein
MIAALPKPHLGIRPNPKRLRLPERKAVTIGIGIHCNGGVVLAADQQQTVDGYYKIHSTKIGNIVYGGATILWTYSHLPNLATAMKDGLLSKLPFYPPTYNEEQVRCAIFKEIDEMKNLYPTQMEQQEFLYAFSCGSGARFLRVSGGIIDEPSWACIGVGDSSLVNYIFKTLRFTPPHFMATDEAVFLAIYMIYLAKRFVDKVGGPTDVIVLENGDGHPDFIPEQSIERIEAKFESMQYLFRDLYNILTNKDADAERLLSDLRNSVNAFRKQGQ